MAAVILAVDAMGGDHGPAVTVPACLELLRCYPECSIILVGDEAQLRPLLPYRWRNDARLRIEHTQEAVASDDSVVVALRKKKRSSMRLVLECVERGEAHAAISAGNTGALMALAKNILKTHPAIDRPAILTALPTQHGSCQMLDLGANVDAQPEHLLQFARMGDIVARGLAGQERPRVALLNIGEEDIKGNEVIKKAHRLLQESTLHYIGYVEGDGIFKGEADVVVCDGFVGNIALKVSEGVARMLAQRIRAEIERSWWRKAVGGLAWPIWQGLKRQMDPALYNGASLVGLRGLVVKSHGGASQAAFYNALTVALREVEHDVPGLMLRELAQ